jgi:hypothetical protein
MSIENFNTLPWESICYASVTLCCIAFVFKHCFETVEKILQLLVLAFAGLGIYITWTFIKENGWQAAWVLLSSRFEKQLPTEPIEAPIEFPPYQFLKKLWA